MDNTEAIKIVNAIKPFVQEWTKEWEHSCLRVKQMTVTTAPADGVIGVTEGFGDEITIPHSTMLQNAVVGDVVYCCWIADNQATMIAMWEGSMTQTQVPVETGIKYVQLWMNPNTGNSFSSQTITVTGAENYSVFIITFLRRAKESPPYYGLVNVNVIENNIRYAAISADGFTEGNAGGYASRNFRRLGSSFQFEDAGAGYNTENSFMIPYKIFGVKGAEVIYPS